MEAKTREGSFLKFGEFCKKSAWERLSKKIAGKLAGQILAVYFYAMLSQILPDSPTQQDISVWERLGFRYGAKGALTSRTLMVAELREVIAATNPDSTRDEIRVLVNEDNLLHKPTVSSRKLTLRRLQEIYTLDSSVVLWRVFRRYLSRDAGSFSHLALLFGLAREPLLRATAPVIQAMVPGEELRRDALRSALLRETEGRLNPSISDKVARNAAASWTQAGYLKGRTFKFREKVTPTPAALAFALFLGYAQGVRGVFLMQTLWAQILDPRLDSLLELAGEARKRGLLNMRQDGAVFEITFESILEEAERRRIHGGLG